VSIIHRYVNPSRAATLKDKYITSCGATVERYQCVASDFKTTCPECLDKIIEVRQAELELLKQKKLRTPTWL